MPGSIIYMSSLLLHGGTLYVVHANPAIFLFHYCLPNQRPTLNYSWFYSQFSWDSREYIDVRSKSGVDECRHHHGVVPWKSTLLINDLFSTRSCRSKQGGLRCIREPYIKGHTIKGLLRSSLDSCKKSAPRMVTPDGIGMYNRKDLPEREICSKIEYARFLSRGRVEAAVYQSTSLPVYMTIVAL